MAQIRCIFAWALPIPADYRCVSHSHECMEIVFSQSASGVLHQGKGKFAYGDESVFVYQPGVEHWIENKQPGEHLCIGVVGYRAELVPEGVWKAAPELQARFREIRATLRSEDPSREMRLDLLAGLVVCDLLAINSTPQAPRTRAQQVRDVIETSLDSPPSLDDLARRVFVSKEYLRQLFREEFGESITSYVIRRRIELAAQLLKSTNDSVKQIAWQTGFPNEYYFSRLFRKLVGVPPSRWR